MPIHPTRLSGVLVLVALLLTAACDWTSGPLERRLWAGDPVPQGFAEYRGSDFRVAYPSGWTVRTGTDRAGHDYVEINGPTTPEGAFRGQVRVVRWPSFPYGFDDRLAEYRRQAARADRGIEKDRPVAIEKARRGHRFDYTARVKAFTGVKVRVRTADTLVLTEEDVLLEFSATALEGAGPELRIPEIVESFKLR